MQEWVKAPLWSDEPEEAEDVEEIKNDEFIITDNRRVRMFDGKMARILHSEDKRRFGCAWCADAYSYADDNKVCVKVKNADLSKVKTMRYVDASANDEERRKRKQKPPIFCPCLTGCTYQAVYDEYDGTYATYDKHAREHQMQGLRRYLTTR